ncbi:HAD-IA family hydrolase [Inhella gelatinilytica]|uniref:phosphoglycolate phosphatase n=1 Tax=Inhella gelatinilytica TaxID=2795030 RepID=A0A931NBG6_9BURK|nr:HAD-IA family hydrolase [Inhella gelatinilytica]MBH9553563.1 HAD-IA family hydrolase [Inhella gelatinilytica]
MSQTIEALWVDLDGTLVDTLGDFVAALEAVARERGWPAPQASDVRQWIGRGGDHLIHDWLSTSRQPMHLQAEVKAQYDRHYRQVNGCHAQVRAGTVQGLNGLQALGLPLACVTNKPQANAHALLAQLGLLDYFAVLVGGSEAVRPKPAPDSLLQAAQRLGVPPSCSLMVGDSENDAAAARAAGAWGVVLLRGGYNHGRPIETEPAWAYLDELSALPTLIAGARCAASLSRARAP